MRRTFLLGVALFGGALETAGLVPAGGGVYGCARRRGEPDLVQAQAVLFVRRDVHHFQIDKAEYCTTFQEVVAVRCLLDKNRETIFSFVYLRPKTSRRCRGNFSQVRQLRVRYPKDRILVASDFNVHHPHWGYNEATPKGRHLEEEAEAADLVLANDLDCPTRHALHSNQRGSIPDLTWATAGFVTDWRCDSDLRGSGHYPIWITLNVTPERDMRAQPNHNRTQIDLKNTPNPDKHLLHLWEDRSKLHAEYLNNGLTHKDLVNVPNKTAQARKHVKLLSMRRWLNYCASFDERTVSRCCGTRFQPCPAAPRHGTLQGMRYPAYKAHKKSLRAKQQQLSSHNHRLNLYHHQTSTRPELPERNDGPESPFTMAELVAALRTSTSAAHPARQKKPGSLVAVDLKKAFDTVRHDAVLGALKEAYPGTKMLNIFKSFLTHRIFEIRSDNRTPQQFENNTGVSQGAILSPILFNVVMRELAQRLERGGQVRMTMYADDITISTEPLDQPTTERVREAIQWALDTTAENLEATGMKASLEKTQYLIFGGADTERNKIDLSLAGVRLQRPPEG
ncbi:hypothetical protein ISCGN_003403 [Ixodes scapularis]